MPKPSLADLRSLPDPLMSYQFALFLQIPTPEGDSIGATLRCQSTSLPGISNDEITVGLHGVEVKYAGRPMYPKTLNVTFLETRDLNIRTSFRSWIEFARNARNNTGQFKANYESQASLVLYDDQENVIDTITLYGLWPQTMDEPQLTGAASDAIYIAITFAYDFHVSEGL